MVIGFLSVCILDPNHGIIIGKECFNEDYILLVSGLFNIIGVIGVDEWTYNEYEVGVKYPEWKAPYFDFEKTLGGGRDEA